MLLRPRTHGTVSTSPRKRPGPDATQAERQQAREIERQQAEAAISVWLDHLATTPWPLEDWMAWSHGHFVSGLDKVKTPLS